MLEIDYTLCPKCNEKIIYYWGKGLVSQPEYVLAGDTLFHTECWNKIIDQYYDAQ